MILIQQLVQHGLRSALVLRVDSKAINQRSLSKPSHVSQYSLKGIGPQGFCEGSIYLNMGVQTCTSFISLIDMGDRRVIFWLPIH